MNEKIQNIVNSIFLIIICAICVCGFVTTLSEHETTIQEENKIIELETKIEELERELEIKELEIGALVYRVDECRGWLNYDNRIETYYSSNVLYHQFTYLWWVDDNGYYRTTEGYYVVACRDLPYGTVFFANDQERVCQVLDKCQRNGVTDFYVNW